MKIIIAGAGAVGTHLAKLLSGEKQDIILMDEDESKLSAMGNNLDLMTVNLSPTSINGLKEAGVAGADLFIGVMPDESRNMTACMLATSLGAKKTVARIDNYEYLLPKHKEFFAKLGVHSLIYPEMLAARDIVDAVKMSWIRQWWEFAGGALVLLGTKMREKAEILNVPLHELGGRNIPFHIVAIKRGNETIIPRGDDVIKLNDIVYFTTTKKYIPYIRKISGKENEADVRNVMIMGGSRIAVRTVQYMPDYMKAKIIESNIARCNRLTELVDDGVMVINGDGRDIQLLMEEGIKNTEAFVALTGNSETNILACLAAKRMGVTKTVAEVENVDYISMAESLDIGTVINKKFIAASHIYQMMLDADVSNVKCLTFANADVADDRRDCEEWNNTLHPNQKKYPGMTRWDVLVAKINPTLRPLDKLTLSRYIGEKVDTSIRRNSTVRVANADWWLSGPEVLEQLEPNNRRVTAYYLPDEEGKPTDVFLFQNDRYLDKVRPVVTYNRVMAEQTEEDRAAYTEQNKVLSHFSKYLNDHAIGKVGTGTPDQPTDDPEEELELPPVELSDDLPADLSADPESDYEWHSGISEAMRAISDM